VVKLCISKIKENVSEARERFRGLDINGRGVRHGVMGIQGGSKTAIARSPALRATTAKTAVRPFKGGHLQGVEWQGMNS
jgi:hypothetical protein